MATACCALAFAIGAAGFAGWVLGRDLLGVAFSFGLAMKANAAIALIAASLALTLRVPIAAGPRLAVGRALAWFVLVTGAATFGQHVFGWNLGIDELLFEEALGAPATTSPGRMGPPASLSFALLGAALLALDRTTSRGRSPSQWLAVLVGFIATLAVTGYLTQTEALYGIAKYTGIALHTAVAILALATAIFLARPTLHPAVLLVQDDAGGQLARRLLPATVLVPIGLQLLRTIAEERGLWDGSFGLALFVLCLILLLAVLVWVTALRLSDEAHLRDRAEQRSAELLQRERIARAEAERAGALKDEFVATVSHELRTPLNAMLGWASMLRQPNVKPETFERGLTVIERNAHAQARLIDDLLDMSRIVSGKLQLDAQRVDLCAVARATLTSIAPTAETKRVSIEPTFEAGSVWVTGDAARLQQVAWNLLSNAVKFTPAGGSIQVRVRQHGSKAELSVQDSGIGIAPDFLPHVFDRFRQADASTTRRHTGLGLGLSIARQLVEAHGGLVAADSKGDGRGATFTVTLPACAIPSTERPSQGGKRPTPTSVTRLDDQSALVGLRVLVVDDDTDARELVTRVLSENGALVSAAADADHALEAFESARAHVLLTDISMPGKDGYWLLRELHLRYGDAAPPAIALTAFAAPADQQRALEHGFRAHLAKPIDLQALLRSVAFLSRSERREPDAVAIQHARAAT